MVGFDPKSIHLTSFEYGLAGAISGVMTRAVCQPMDVLKIRFQLQIEPIAKNQWSKYQGLLQGIQAIRNEEGISALWKGHNPAQLLSIVYGVSQFVTFEILTRQAWDVLPREVTTDWRPTLHFFCGAAAGCAATVASQPFDVIRTRFVGQGEPKVYRSMVHATRSMWVTEGPLALYKGLLPTLIQIVPYSGLQFGFYTFLVTVSDKLVDSSSSSHIGWIRSMICGSIAGVGSKAAVYPLDLAKKRLQIQGFEDARRTFGKVQAYRGLIDCFSKIYKQEGLPGYFKGIVPSLIKAAMATGCHFCFYEQICNGLRWTHYIKQQRHSHPPS